MNRENKSIMPSRLECCRLGALFCATGPRRFRCARISGTRATVAERAARAAACTGSCCLTRAREKIAFPNRKKAGLPEHGLKGDEGKSAEVQSAPPEDADKSPGAPRSQRNHDQTNDIERDHGHVGPEDRRGRGRSRKQLVLHFTGRVITTGVPRE